MCAAPVGNRFWEARSKHGRDKAHTPESLWQAALDYFKWIEDNPLYESVLTTYQGFSKIEEVPKMRAMTIEGFARFANITTVTFWKYSKDKDFINISTQIQECIREQKLTGAAAGFLNANIIARDLGLRDSVSNEHSGPDGGPITVASAELTDEQLAALLNSK